MGDEMRAAGLRLRPVRIDDESEGLRAQKELEADGFVFLLGYAEGMAWSEYVAFLEANRRGERLPDGYVPATFLVAICQGQLVGRSSIRHELSPYLEREGGHIGYGVRPAYRGRGLATTMLEHSVVIARSVGVDRVLVTSDEDNPASSAVIERCGGVFESVVEPEAGGTPIRRYWID